jgi:exopolysaccharide biosynthesis polyprenyl glycosylphosphotransferase
LRPTVVWPAESAAREIARLDRIATREARYRRSLAVSDAFAFAVALVAGTYASGARLAWPALIAVPGIVLLAKLVGLYDRDQNRLHKETLAEVPILFSLATLAALMFYVGQGLFVDGRLDQLGVVTMWASLMLGLFLARALTRSWLASTSETERCLVVGDLPTARMLARKFAVQGTNAQVVGTLQDPAGPPAWTRDLNRRLRAAIVECEADRVVLTSPDWNPDDVLYAVDHLNASGVRVSVLPPVSRLASLSFEVDRLPGIALLGMRAFEISRSSRFVKRAFDLCVAALALLVLAPMMSLIAIAIKLDSPGPMFFRQRRIGRDGKAFEVYKFRTMVADAEKRKSQLAHLNEGDGLFKITRDPRITRVGRLLRRFSLDELPQLINVVRGRMSLVGPRPLIPDEDELIRGAYRRRLEIPPGMTGHWQILGSWRLPLDEMATLDYLYVANWSLWRDVQLLARTIPYVIARKNV